MSTYDEIFTQHEKDCLGTIHVEANAGGLRLAKFIEKKTGAPVTMMAITRPLPGGQWAVIPCGILVTKEDLDAGFLDKYNLAPQHLRGAPKPEAKTAVKPLKKLSKPQGRIKLTK